MCFCTVNEHYLTLQSKSAKSLFLEENGIYEETTWRRENTSSSNVQLKTAPTDECLMCLKVGCPMRLFVQGLLHHPPGANLHYLITSTQ